MNGPVPQNEVQRLREQERLNNTGLQGSEELDAATKMASKLFDCPVAIITILGKDSPQLGIDISARTDQAERRHDFRDYTMQSDGLIVVTDTAQDLRFNDNPYVTGEPGIGFFAGQPISLDGSGTVGAFYLLDTKPREFGEADQFQFVHLAKLVEGLLCSFDSAQHTANALALAKSQEEELNRHSVLLEKVTTVSGVGGWELTLGSDKPVWTDQTRRIHEVADYFTPDLSEAINFYAPEVRPKIQKAVEDGIALGIGWDMELPLITGKGRRIWARAVGEPTYTDGRVTGLVGTFQDITEQKNNELQLQRSEQFARERHDELNVMLASMKSGVSVFDKDGNLQLWNDQYLAIFEKPPEEIQKGISFKEILRAEKVRGEFTGNVDNEISKLLSGLETGKPVTRQFELKCGKVIASVHAPMPGGGWVGTHDDITEQELAARSIAHAANHDALTELANRKQFNDRCASAVTQLKSEDEALALMLIDLDGFKQVNDAFGHHAGDDLLKQVARRLESCVRGNDLLARLGGDEFAVLIDCHSVEKVDEFLGAIAQRIIKKLTDKFQINGDEINIGASVGISLFQQGPDMIERALQNADCALYAVKENGKNGFRVFDAGIHIKVSQKKMREVALREVVKSKEFELFYQPVHRTSNGARTGFEALIRWNSTHYPVQYPSDFIPMAEQLGLIGEIGEWVMNTSIAEASTWRDDLSLAMNISSRQLGHDRVFELVSGALEKWQFAAHRLELEITEYTMLQDDPGTIAELNKLKDIGVRIVLDDFGAGYSALSYLHQFPFDKLKIDRSFLKGFEHSPQKSTIVRAITQMAESLGIEVTAEGVESDEQLQLLKLVGCDYAQGYYLGKPKSVMHLNIDRAFSTNSKRA